MATEEPVNKDSTVHVRRGRVCSVDLYEVKDSELDILEKGSTGGINLNFAIFLLSTAVTCIAALASTNFQPGTVKNIFLFTAIIGFLLGVYLLIRWRKDRQSIVQVVSTIRNRIPPEESEPLVTSTELLPVPPAESPASK